MSAADHFNMSAIMFIMGLLITASLDFTVAQIGVAYGRNGDNLPLPPQVVRLYKQYGIQRMRIYEPRKDTLDALRGSNIELTMSILNPYVKDIASNQANADTWVQNNVRSYPDVRFRSIVVGNEISPTSENSQFVLQAMQNIYRSISAAGLVIRVTTSIGTGLLAPPAFPPEDGKFTPEAAQYLKPIIQFLVSTKAPLFGSIYPYFSYIQTPGMDLRYALLDPSFQGVTTIHGTTYQNLFYALVDTVYSAVEKIVQSFPELSDSGISNMEIGGGESGWPTAGGSRKASADDVSSVENARTYINNLIQVVKRGTPKRPGRPIETYIFAMFDENLKPGNEDEKHFGLFTRQGQLKYPVNFN